MKERIKAIEEYLKYFPNEIHAVDNLKFYKYAEIFGIEPSDRYYPKISQGRFMINDILWADTKYWITNSTTGYVHNKEDIVVVWSAFCGRLEFVSKKYWNDVEDEWRWFKTEKLLSYNPIDYDYINDTYVFDLENGKRFIKDYPIIVSELKEKLDKKIKA